ncbi:MAG: SPASM domain-containing protein [Deferribacteraceae bacterium]|jgi:radical SAM protein with 4Fe4S-binding SPASM domain|nr:SPASM domain-containing protein [Deferribacteraceae bacterium]
MKSKIRAEKNAILLYNGDDTQTVYVAGKELDLLKKWLTHNSDVAFTLRLKRAGLLDDSMRDSLMDAIIDLDRVSAPLRSLTVPESLHIELTGKTNRGKKLALPYSRYSEVLTEAETVGVLQIDLEDEQLSYPHLIEAVEEAYGRGMTVALHSKGTLLDIRMVEKLVKAGLDRLQVFLYSIDDFDSRNKAAIGAMSLAGHVKLPFGINWVLRQDNLEDFPTLITAACSFGADNVTLLRYQPCSGEAYADVALSGSRLLKLAELIKSTKRITIRLDSAFSMLANYINKQAEPTILSGCGAGRRFVTMDASGNFCPCRHMRFTSDGGTLMDYWLNSPQLADFRAIEEHIGTDCRECKYMPSCRGCRAITTYLTRFEDGEKDCIFAKGL